MANVRIELNYGAVRSQILNNPSVKEYCQSMADVACERFGYTRSGDQIESHGSGQRVWVKVPSISKEG